MSTQTRYEVVSIKRISLAFGGTLGSVVVILIIDYFSKNYFDLISIEEEKYSAIQEITWQVVATVNALIVAFLALFTNKLSNVHYGLTVREILCIPRSWFNLNFYECIMISTGCNALFPVSIAFNSMAASMAIALLMFSITMYTIYKSLSISLDDTHMHYVAEKYVNELVTQCASKRPDEKLKAEIRSILEKICIDLVNRIGQGSLMESNAKGDYDYLKKLYGSVFVDDKDTINQLSRLFSVLSDQDDRYGFVRILEILLQGKHNHLVNSVIKKRGIGHWDSMEMLCKDKLKNDYNNYFNNDHQEITDYIIINKDFVKSTDIILASQFGFLTTHTMLCLHVDHATAQLTHNSSAPAFFISYDACVNLWGNYKSIYNIGFLRCIEWSFEENIERFCCFMILSYITYDMITADDLLKLPYKKITQIKDYLELDRRDWMDPEDYYAEITRYKSFCSFANIEIREFSNRVIDTINLSLYKHQVNRATEHKNSYLNEFHVRYKALILFEYEEMLKRKFNICFSEKRTYSIFIPIRKEITLYRLFIDELNKRATNRHDTSIENEVLKFPDAAVEKIIEKLLKNINLSICNIDLRITECSDAKIDELSEKYWISDTQSHQIRYIPDFFNDSDQYYPVSCSKEQAKEFAHATHFNLMYEIGVHVQRQY